MSTVVAISSDDPIARRHGAGTAAQLREALAENAASPTD